MTRYRVTIEGVVTLDEIAPLLKNGRHVRMTPMEVIEERSEETPPKKPKRFWSAARDLRLMKLHQEGYTYADIAKKLNISKGSVSARLVVLRKQGAK